MPDDATRFGPVPYGMADSNWPGLAKLIEEAGEVLQVAGKLLQAGGSPDHWDGDLRARLEEELGDLLAAADFLTLHSPHLSALRIDDRVSVKTAVFERWRRELADE